jgi:hypothetical protein
MTQSTELPSFSGIVYRTLDVATVWIMTVLMIVSSCREMFSRFCGMEWETRREAVRNHVYVEPFGI